MANVRAFRAYSIAIGGLTAAVAGALALRGQVPPAATLALFAALMVYSEHRSVEVANGTAVNADFLIMMAAVVAMRGSDGAVLGPLIVGASRGIYVPLVKERSWSVIGANAASGALAAAVTAVVLAALPESAIERMPQALATSVAMAALCAWALVLVVAIGFVARGLRSPRDFIAMLLSPVVESLPFLMLGFFLGAMYLDLGASVMILIVVPMFIAREMFASYMKVKDGRDETVKMLIGALETKDQYTAGHSGRVATYAQYMGEEFKFGPGRMERLRFAALMHDIGKLVVPNHILNKPGKLTEEEFARVRLHETVTGQMLSHIEFLRPIAEATHSDAMRFDPDDNDHPIEPYMVMIADAYDAMTSTRSYRKALSQEIAFQELRDKSGTQFHPECVEALIRALEKRGEVHGAGHEEQSEFMNAPEAGLGSAGLGDLITTSET